MCIVLYLYIIVHSQYPLKNVSYPKPEINQYHVEGCNINTMNIENTEKDSLPRSIQAIRKVHYELEQTIKLKFLSYHYCFCIGKCNGEILCSPSPRYKHSNGQRYTGMIDWWPTFMVCCTNEQQNILDRLSMLPGCNLLMIMYM